MDKEQDYIYKNISYDIIGCAFAAFKAVGVGFNEVIYHKIFHNYLLEKGLNSEYKVPVYIDYLGERIATFEADEIVETKFIVELKCIQTDFLPENIAQIMTYLKTLNLRNGLLINFGLQKAHPKRIVFDEQRKADEESWDEGFFQRTYLDNMLESIIASIRRVNNILGVAYHNKIYQDALRIEFKNNKINYRDDISIPVKLENIQFTPMKINFWVIEDSILLAILAGKSRPKAYDIFRMRNYLNKLKLTHGLIAYWSTKNLQLIGIYEP